MKRLIILSCSILSVLTVIAQDRNDFQPERESRVTAGVHIGTQGFGVNGTYQLSQRWMLNLATSYGPYGYTTTRTLGKNDYDIKLKEKIGNVQLTAGWKPFGLSHTRNFVKALYINGGLAAFYQMEANATATPNKDYRYGDIIIKKEDLGQVDANVTWNKVAPYGGLGLRGLSLGKRIVFNADLGTYYLSKPEVHITATNLLSENTAQEAQVQKNLENYRWLPVLQAGVSYKF